MMRMNGEYSRMWDMVLVEVIHLTDSECIQREVPLGRIDPNEINYYSQYCHNAEIFDLNTIFILVENSKIQDLGTNSRDVSNGTHKKALG